MKKTILFMALALGSICLTSCARGYGCPYTMDTKIQPAHPSSVEKKETVNDLVMVSDEQGITNDHLTTK